jgi:hypothetical protein
MHSIDHPLLGHRHWNGVQVHSFAYRRTGIVVFGQQLAGFIVNKIRDFITSAGTTTAIGGLCVRAVADLFGDAGNILSLGAVVALRFTVAVIGVGGIVVDGVAVGILLSGERFFGLPY